MIPAHKKKENQERKADKQLTYPATKDLSDKMVQIKQQEKYEPLTERYVSELLSSTKTRWIKFVSKRKILIISALALISWIIFLGLITLVLTDF